MTDEERAKHRERVRRWREGQRAKGLCIQCSEPADPGHTACPLHRQRSREKSQTDAHKEYHAAWRRKRILKRLGLLPGAAGEG